MRRFHEGARHRCGNGVRHQAGRRRLRHRGPAHFRGSLRLHVISVFGSTAPFILIQHISFGNTHRHGYRHADTDGHPDSRPGVGHPDSRPGVGHADSRPGVGHPGPHRGSPATGGGGTAGFQHGLVLGLGILAVLAGAGGVIYRRRVSGGR